MKVFAARRRKTAGARPAAGPHGLIRRSASAQALRQDADMRAVLPAPLRKPPPGAVLRAPFDSESSTDHTRRQTLLRSISNALGVVLGLLQTGGLLRGVEVAVERNGIRGVAINAGTAQEIFASYAQRDKTLRRIVGSLQAMGSRYRTAPIPPDFAAPTADPSGRFTSTVEYRKPDSPDPATAEFTRLTPEWADLQGAYYRQLVAQGLLFAYGPEYLTDGYYLDPTAIVTPGAAQGARRASGGTPSGAYVVFPDIEHEPLRYRILDGLTSAPRGSDIIDLWHDDFGYYYERKDQRIYVPAPWESSRK